jgi:hypothetical protein
MGLSQSKKTPIGNKCLIGGGLRIFLKPQLLNNSWGFLAQPVVAFQDFFWWFIYG